MRVPTMDSSFYWLTSTSPHRHRPGIYKEYKKYKKFVTGLDWADCTGHWAVVHQVSTYSNPTLRQTGVCIAGQKSLGARNNHACELTGNPFSPKTKQVVRTFSTKFTSKLTNHWHLPTCFLLIKFLGQEGNPAFMRLDISLFRACTHAQYRQSSNRSQGIKEKKKDIYMKAHPEPEGLQSGIAA